MVKAASVRPVIRKLVSRLVEETAPQKVILFGSHAAGRPDADSDIDLLIIAETQEPFFQRLARVRKAVAGLHPGIPFDPLVLTPGEVDARLRAGDQFIEEALAHGEVLYAA